MEYGFHCKQAKGKGSGCTSKNPVKIPSALHCLESQACRHGDTRNIMPSTARNCIPLLFVCFFCFPSYS
ncbi:hypothetical protein BDA96_04G358500 [Sorghum bicolor]|uniref:Uncharacterized protein n=2 Tax=Sorghum bicolor TaxID=4558 RepID=A0A921ULB2_SORBI|nr:hypothetical protein BDA96_04G358500 [Sorghum bicolor]KXG31301.1 hypothetical protein SORBI_3004G335300 [Sorghum bicolor]